MGAFGFEVLDWMAVVLAWVIGLSALAAVYLLGRAHGRQAQRRANVRTVIEDAIAETVAIPRREPEQ